MSICYTKVSMLFHQMHILTQGRITVGYGIAANHAYLIAHGRLDMTPCISRHKTFCTTQYTAECKKFSLVPPVKIQISNGPTLIQGGGPFQPTMAIRSLGPAAVFCTTPMAIPRTPAAVRMSTDRQTHGRHTDKATIETVHRLRRVDGIRMILIFGTLQ